MSYETMPLEVAPPQKELGLDERLRQLGFEPQLRRKLSMWQTVGLSMADISPTMAVFLLATGALSVGGTGTFNAMLLVSLAVVCIALVMGELGSIYPLAGGVYSLVRYSMSGVWVPVAMFNLLFLGIIIPAMLVLGAAQFLLVLFPNIPLNASWLALILTAIMLAIALRSITFSADITIFMIIIELVILTTLTISGLFHIHRSVGTILFHPVVLQGKSLAPVGFGLVLAALAPTFNIINGYDAVLGLSEETKGTGRTIAYAVIICAVLAAVTMTIPLGISMLSAPSITQYLRASSPPVYSLAAGLGSWAGTLANIGVTLALFNSALACFVYYARIWFTSGRDAVWPEWVNRHLQRTNGFGAPWVALLVCVVPWCVLLFLSTLNWIIIFSGSVLAAEYFFVGAAGLWCRIGRTRTEPRPFKMPLWPLPPVIVLLLTGFALTQQGNQYKLGEAVLCGLAVYYIAMRLSGRTSIGEARPPTPPASTAALESRR